jgi:hypothetical protein
VSSSNSVHKITSIGNFRQAALHFIDTKKPRTTRWADNARPLYNTASTHYSLVKVNEDTYDLVNYRTSLVRYFRPTTEGYEVWLRSWDSNTSWAFLDHHGWNTWYQGRSTQDGKRVEIPLNPYATGDALINDTKIPDGWSAVLYFNADGTLDLTRSAHRPVYRKVSSEGDIAKRAQFRTNMGVLLDGIMFRLPSYQAAADFNLHKTRAFREAVEWAASNACRKALEKAEQEGWEPTDEAVNAISEYAKQYYEAYVNREVIKKAEGLRGKHPAWEAYATTALGEMLQEIQVEVPAFRAKLLAALLRCTGLVRASGRVPLEQFSESLPKQYFY